MTINKDDILKIMKEKALASIDKIAEEVAETLIFSDELSEPKIMKETSNLRGNLKAQINSLKSRAHELKAQGKESAAVEIEQQIEALRAKRNSVHESSELARAYRKHLDDHQWKANKLSVGKTVKVQDKDNSIHAGHLHDQDVKIVDAKSSHYRKVKDKHGKEHDVHINALKMHESESALYAQDHPVGSKVLHSWGTRGRGGVFNVGVVTKHEDNKVHVRFPRKRTDSVHSPRELVQAQDHHINPQPQSHADVQKIKEKNPSAVVHHVGTQVTHKPTSLGGHPLHGKVGVVHHVEDHGAGMIAHYVKWEGKKAPTQHWGSWLKPIAHEEVETIVEKHIVVKKTSGGVKSYFKGPGVQPNQQNSFTHDKEQAWKFDSKENADKHAKINGGEVEMHVSEETLDETKAYSAQDFANGALLKHDKDNDNRMHMYKEHGTYHIRGFKKGKHFTDTAEKHSEAMTKFKTHKKELSEETIADHKIAVVHSKHGELKKFAHDEVAIADAYIHRHHKKNGGDINEYKLKKVVKESYEDLYEERVKFHNIATSQKRVRQIKKILADNPDMISSHKTGFKGEMTAHINHIKKNGGTVAEDTIEEAASDDEAMKAVENRIGHKGKLEKIKKYKDGGKTHHAFKLHTDEGIETHVATNMGKHGWVVNKTHTQKHVNEAARHFVHKHWTDLNQHVQVGKKGGYATKADAQVKADMLNKMKDPHEIDHEYKVHTIGVVEEDQLDEISKKTLGSYIKKSTAEVSSHSYDTGKETEKAFRHNDRKEREKHFDNAELAADKSGKRQKGIMKAVTKLTTEEVDQKGIKYRVMSGYDHVLHFKGDKARDSAMAHYHSLIKKDPKGTHAIYRSTVDVDGKIASKPMLSYKNGEHSE